MTAFDKEASMNKEAWEAAVLRGEGSTKPYLDLNAQLVDQYARGELSSR